LDINKETSVHVAVAATLASNQECCDLGSISIINLLILGTKIFFLRFNKKLGPYFQKLY